MHGSADANEHSHCANEETTAATQLDRRRQVERQAQEENESTIRELRNKSDEYHNSIAIIERQLRDSQTDADKKG